MKQYKSKRIIILIIDLVAIVVSFFIAFGIRSVALSDNLGVTYGLPMYLLFLACALLLYVVVCLIIPRTFVEKLTVGEVILRTVEYQIVFMAGFMVVFFVLRKADLISRVFVGLFGLFNVLLCCVGRLIYRSYCLKRNQKITEEHLARNEESKTAEDMKAGSESCTSPRHVFIIGSKSIGLYGGFESFVMNLLNQHKDDKQIQYHVACKANGSGFMDIKKLQGVVSVNDDEFTYCNAHCVLIHIPEKLGVAQAVYYDIEALKWACDYIEKNHIVSPIVYILASRIGPFEKKYVERIHDAEGLVYQNPDGHEDLRRKWSLPIRKYWKFSERYAVKNADLVVCDSKNIESYIRDEYSEYNPRTEYISYGSYVSPDKLPEDDSKYKRWLDAHGLTDGNFYISVGRFVEENNFDVMIREFMMSSTKKDFAIITTENSKLSSQLQQKLNYRKDRRIKFVGTVYDAELLAKIRTGAYGYFHGHEVGGTNPSLLESLGYTDLNLLLDVSFNREVAEDAAMYWGKGEGELSRLIDRAEQMSAEEKKQIGERARRRILEAYTWETIGRKYAEIFRN